MPKKVVLTRLFLLFFVTVITLVGSLFLCELLLRTYGYEDRPIWWAWAVYREENGVFRLDPKRIYALKHDVSKHDSTGTYFDDIDLDAWGFREGISPNCDNPTKKVFLVGDSFIYGHSLYAEETLASNLQKMLNDNTDCAVVINAGVQGYGPGQTYRYLKDELIPNHQPEVIVWNINQNDFYDMQLRSLHLLSNNELIPMPAVLHGLYLQGLLQKSGGYLFPSSKLLNLVYANLQTFDPVTLLQPQTDELIDKKIGLMIKDIHDYQTSQQRILIITQALNQYYFSSDQNPNTVIEQRNRIKAIAGEYPGYVDLSYETMKVLGASTQDNRATVDFDKDYAQELFLSGELDEDPYGWRHPSGQGNKYAAEVLYNYLKDKGYIE